MDRGGRKSATARGGLNRGSLINSKNSGLIGTSSRFHSGQANAMPLFSESSNFGAVDCIASLCVFYFKSAVWRFLS